MPSLKEIENYIDRVLDSAPDNKIKILSDVHGDHPIRTAAKNFYESTDSPMPKDISLEELLEIIKHTKYPNFAKEYIDKLIISRLAAANNPKKTIRIGPEKSGLGSLKRKRFTKIT